MTAKDLIKWVERRTKLVDYLLEKLEKEVTAAQRGMAEIIADEFLESLERDEKGNIKNTLSNKRRLALLDKAYNRFVNTKGIEIIKTMAEGTSRVLDFNASYYEGFTTAAALKPIAGNVHETLEAWLGITRRGAITPNGYLDTLLRDSTVKNEVRTMTVKAVVSQAGFFEAKKGLREFIEGNKEKAGALQRYYRNFVYDTYSKVDRTAAGVFADKLKLNYAIYEGGLIKTSREFCIKRNGKVFTREEIAKFNPPEAKPPGYDPFTDLGGYGCRHHLNWVPDALAFALRPELRNL